MAVRVEIHGVEEVRRKLEQVARDLQPALQGAMGEAGSIVQKSAQAYSPVRTGRLRASIMPEVVIRDTIVEAIVGSGVPYAGIQEERRGFLRRALAENVQKVVDLLDRAIARIVEK